MRNQMMEEKNYNFYIRNVLLQLIKTTAAVCLGGRGGIQVGKCSSLF